jgi:hypothetical protein
MDREVRVFKKLPGPQQRLEVVASLRYKCEFSVHYHSTFVTISIPLTLIILISKWYYAQELFEFNINFKDWQIEQKKGEAPQLPRYTWLSFQVNRSKATFLDTLLTCLKGCIPCVSNPKRTQLRLLEGSSLNQSFLKYPGTRAWLVFPSYHYILFLTFTTVLCLFPSLCM